MRSAFALTVAALAGAALAAPHQARAEVKNLHVVVQTVVKTVYVTEGYEVSKPTPSPEPVYQAPAVTSAVYQEPAAPAPTVVYSAPAAPVYSAPAAPVYSAPAAPVYSAAPAPSPSAAPAPAPAPVGSGYMAVVDTWRAKLGLPALTQDSKLESNAMDTVVASNGVMVHKLNPGTMGQVLAPMQKSFEHVFVGGWLCEIPTLPGLDGICATESEGWTYEGQTGHAELLTSKSYTKIGCALHEGIQCCDLA